MASTARIREANEAIKEADPSLNKNARQMLLAQAMVESQFGDSHKTPTGASSYNWGNIYAKGDLGTIPVGDSQDGVPFTANAAWNSSDEVGARQLVKLIRDSYGALGEASAGNLHGYAKALFRDNKRPYYGGFPPGNPNSLAPKGTPMHSELDHYWRVMAYKRYVERGAKQVAAALGESFTMNTSEPSPPLSASSFPWSFFGVTGVTVLLATSLYGWQAGWFDKMVHGRLRS